MINPELAILTKEPPSGKDWIHELKFDGYRMIAIKNNQSVQLFSRNHNNWTNYFSNVITDLKELPVQTVILDGEIVLLDKDNRSNFQLLKNAIHSKKKHSFIYYIFDLIYINHFNLSSLMLIERKNILHTLIKDQGSLRFSDHIVGFGNDIFKHACQMGLEGIVSKKISSPYIQKRNPNWLKVKCVNRQEFVIAGFTPPKHSRHYFGSLYLGVYDDSGTLIFCGNVGTGFDEASLKQVYHALQAYITHDNPFAKNPPGSRTAIWLKPILIAEVEFREWTNGGILRHASFKGLRTDKTPKQIHREKQLSMREVKAISKKKIFKNKKNPIVQLTNPDKILYQEDHITKKDIANYYMTIKKYILPFIVNRPLSLVRCPNTYKTCFYQKHANEGTPQTISSILVKEKQKTDNYIYIKDESGLMSLVQMGTLEIHPWGSQIENIDYPDMIIFDLDPSPETEWKAVVKAAKRIRKYFKSYQLESFVKTTGGKGLHVIIPILPEYSWEKIKNFAQTFVEALVQKFPAEYVSKMSKAKRKEKIFIDYLRNLKGATSVAAYSTRARRFAPISVPLSWKELTNHRKDTFYTLATLPKKLARRKKDPWHNFFKLKQSLKNKFNN